MTLLISKANRIIKGKVSLPSSKSISNRLLIIRSLSNESFQIDRLSEAEDTSLLKNLLELNNAQLDAGNAGTAFRFLTAFLSMVPGDWILTGNERMKSRPVGPLVTALNSLGAAINFTDKENFPPLRIKGKILQGGSATIDANLSSQFVSALLMIAPRMKNGLHLEFKGDISSRPYIEMTLELMNKFGVRYTWDQTGINVPHQEYLSQSVTVESDWSAAASWYELAAFADEAELFLEGLTKDSLQGDRIIAEWMKAFGVITTYQNDGVTITKAKGIVYPEIFEQNFINQPDLLPVFACTCAGLGITAKLTGVKNLRIKESDRLVSLKNELQKFGVRVEIVDDDNTLKIYPSGLHPPLTTIHSYNDHRIAMSLAPLSMLTGTLKLDDSRAVAKSYPGFWDELKNIGFDLTADQN